MTDLLYGVGALVLLAALLIGGVALIGFCIALFIRLVFWGMGIQ